MLTQEDDVEIHTLAHSRWSKSALARHTGRNRRTVAKDLAGNGPTKGPALTYLEAFRAHHEARFIDDPHVARQRAVRGARGASWRLDSIARYPTLVREIRELSVSTRKHAVAKGPATRMRSSTGCDERNLTLRSLARRASERSRLEFNARCWLGGASFGHVTCAIKTMRV